jgi:NADP-dependent 3-hydroxy acid dehydrogenase YdfG
LFCFDLYDKGIEFNSKIMKKRVVIMGATSGVGKMLVAKFLHDGFIVGAAGRRVELLEELKVQAGGLQMRVQVQVQVQVLVQVLVPDAACLQKSLT